MKEMYGMIKKYILFRDADWGPACGVIDITSVIPTILTTCIICLICYLEYIVSIFPRVDLHNQRVKHGSEETPG